MLGLAWACPLEGHDVRELYEIFSKSVSAFTEEAGHEEAFAYLYSLLCFFVGIVLIRGISKCTLAAPEQLECMP